ncbi:hypothetical protein MHBO_003157 [Bonamia ostreae]|uniref:Uncharacterized protein n=1 Tax=Bonamia ostreae TaxID=126728 RepID=A0ABV2APM5_9EUKA
MEKLTSNGKAPDQNLCSQLREATIILAKLEKSVEDEEIDLDGYLKSVRKSVKNLEILAQFLETENRPELEEVLRRLVVMKKELETAKTQLII